MAVPLLLGYWPQDEDEVKKIQRKLTESNDYHLITFTDFVRCVLSVGML